ncbi:MAG TPA: FAD-dependent oxidoreductase [Streptosporangiaceae bacterium]
MTASVIVIGGGYGGIAAAKALDDVADVVLAEPRDAFVHNVAALRALVDPAWAERMFLPYDRLLARGRIVRDRAVRADSTGVTLGSGERLAADFIVLATGSVYPFPAKTDLDDSAASKATFRAAGAELAAAGRVLLLGAGPVGLELAGEIKAAWPAKTVTIVDPAEHILTGGYPGELRDELRRQLDQMGVELRLGTALRDLPPTETGQTGTFAVATGDGRKITADIWYRCFGVAPVTGFLGNELAPARQPGGHLAVTPELRLPGQERVFAIGDLTAIPEAKRAAAASQHAEVAAASIRSLITGQGELRRYQPAAPSIVLPLGPAGGAGYRADVGLLDAAMTAQIKGQHMMVDRFAEMLGAK